MVGIDGARQLAGPDGALLATIVPSLGPARSRAGSARDQLLLLDAVCRWLEAVAANTPVVVVLDDLQWADAPTLSLLDMTARSPEPAAVCVIGCYRPGELGEAARAQLPAMATAVEHIELGGLDRCAVGTVVAGLATVPPEGVDEIYRRGGGHPVFSRELAMVWARGDPTGLPTAVRDAIELRVRRLAEPTRRVLEVAALMGNEIQVGVVASVLGVPGPDVAASCGPAISAGMLVGAPEGPRFAHDLYRETLAASLEPARRPAIHVAIGAALEERQLHGITINPADVARHFICGMSIDGAARAARWALSAAGADRAAFSFAEAAGQLKRWRDAVAMAGVAVDDGLQLEMIIAEADALARAGMPTEARELLRVARDVAKRTGAWLRLGEVALAVAQLGAEFSARRDEVVRDLEEALAAGTGRDTRLEARLAARLARELQHSVAADRPRAGPLSVRALELGRDAGDPETLVACLLAHHDLLWAPGGAAARVDVAREIVATSEQAGDAEHRAEGLLLLANALLEQASPAFLPALEQCFSQLEKLGQVRHRYTIQTRRAAIALLVGDLDSASALIEKAAEFGNRIREPDAGNVRMSQRLELVRERHEPEELIAFATEAVRHWTGAPILAHALAAGFLARAGELAGAGRHLATVRDLGTWRADRSYMWSGLVRELSMAAIALRDAPLCSELLADLLPIAGTCGTNGAVISFAGSHAHTAGLLSAELGFDGAPLFAQARDAYRRLGAAGWLAELELHQEGAAIGPRSVAFFGGPALEST
jgi:hypothetical protein